MTRATAGDESASVGWWLVYEGFEPATEPLREALCTLGRMMAFTDDGIH